MSEDKQEYVMIFEAPKIEPPEFRLYYDDSGKILFYTCEKPEGKYIVIDKLTFACARYDVKVVDGRVVSSNPAVLVSKLVPEISGICCINEDVSIVVDDNYENKTYWKLKNYEL